MTRALTSSFVPFDASPSAVVVDSASAASVGGASSPSPAAMRSSGPIASHPSAASCAFGWFCTVVPSTSAAAARSLACGDDATYRTRGSKPPSVCRSPPLSTPLTRSVSSSMSSTRASISSASCVASIPALMQAMMSFMRLISSMNPLSMASRSHRLSSSEISRAGAEDVPSPCCAMDHLRMAFQLDLSAGTIRSFSSLMAGRGFVTTLTPRVRSWRAVEGSRRKKRHRARDGFWPRWQHISAMASTSPTSGPARHIPLRDVHRRPPQHRRHRGMPPRFLVEDTRRLRRPSPERRSHRHHPRGSQRDDGRQPR